MKIFRINTLRSYLPALLGSILVLVLVYHLSIYETINLYHEYVELKGKEAEMKDVHERLFHLREEESRLNSQIGFGSKNAGLDLLEMLADYCQENNLILESIPPSEEKMDEGIFFHNQSFVIQGSFQSVLQLIQTIEEKDHLGKIISVKYNVRTGRRSRKRRLYALCVVQNILIENHEI